MKKLLSALLFNLTFTLITACDDELTTVPTYSIDNTDFEIKISGFGEIEAANAQRILTPGTQAMAIS